MIVTKRIEGKHKLRDAKIVDLYATGQFSEKQLAEKFNLSQVRVSQIVKKNVGLLLESKDWDRFERIQLIKTELKRKEFHDQILTKKDLLELWRKETHGDDSNSKPSLVQNNFHVYAPAKEDSEDVIEIESSPNTIEAPKDSN